MWCTARVHDQVQQGQVLVCAGMLLELGSTDAVVVCAVLRCTAALHWLVCCHRET